MTKSQDQSIVVILDNVRSLYNVGAIFRTCDGAGVEKLYLTGITGYPTQSKRAQRQIEKTALSTIPYVDWEYHVQISQVLKMLKVKGYQIMVLEQTKNSIKYSEVPTHNGRDPDRSIGTSNKYKHPIALVVGHETLGVSKEAIQLADLAIHIPMYGHAKSLNVATAAGIMIYHLTQQHNQSIVKNT